MVGLDRRTKECNDDITHEQLLNRRPRRGRPPLKSAENNIL